MAIQWNTEVIIPESKNKLTYHTSALFLGSCFSDNISGLLRNFKFQILANPTGTLYNPYSIQTVLRLLMGDYHLDHNDFLYQNNQWYSWLANTTHYASTQEELSHKLNLQIEQGRQFLQKAEFLFITFGTAWVYRYNPTQRIVANCHKVNEKHFTRFRLSVCDITDEYDMLLKSLWEFNPKLKIVFTVSPIRHWKDGAIENNLSKSILNVAIHQLMDIYETQVFYFPAYEIVMDELRDYRFYAEDMIHLTNQTINHILVKFSQTYFDEETRKKHAQIQKILSAVEHRPINPNDESYRNFCSKVLEEIAALETRFPWMDWSAEREKLSRNTG